MKDEAAVTAVLDLPWSNRPTEVRITELEPVERQTYGRGTIDLRLGRVICAA